MFALLAALLGLAVVLVPVSRRRGARHVQGNRDPNPVRTSGLTIAIVRVRIPWYAPAFPVRRGFRAAVPEYEAIPTLEDKYFTLTEDGYFGGIYVWHSRDAAQAYYSAAWRRGVRERRGTEPEVTPLDVVAVIDGGIRLEGGDRENKRLLRSAAPRPWSRNSRPISSIL